MKRTPEEERRAHATYLNNCRAEVEWYRRYGRHADRVRVDGHGVKYVVGDWSWNRNHPDRREHIEDVLLRLKIGVEVGE